MNRVEPEHVYRDFPVDPAYTPSYYISLKFGEPGQRIFGQILVPDGRYEAPRPCVLLWHGFPGAVRMDDLAHALCRAGCVAVVAHYRGAWGSEGRYTLTGIVEDAVRIAEYMREEGPAMCNVDPEAIFFFGHSMGACASINAARRLPWLRGLILAAPYDPAPQIDRDDAAAFISLMQYGEILHSDGVDAMIADGIKHRDELSYLEAFPYIQDQNIFLLYGESDTLAPPADMVFPLWDRLRALGADAPGIRQLKSYPVGHGLYGARTIVAEDTAKFIRDCLEAADGIS